MIYVETQRETQREREETREAESAVKIKRIALVHQLLGTRPKPYPVRIKRGVP